MEYSSIIIILTYIIRFLSLEICKLLSINDSYNISIGSFSNEIINNKASSYEISDYLFDHLKHIFNINNDKLDIDSFPINKILNTILYNFLDIYFV